jgi:hypothetical protein
LDNMGSDDPLEWDALWDDEVFRRPDGTYLILGNITGPGGSLWLKWDGKYWDEVLLDEETGEIDGNWLK